MTIVFGYWLIPALITIFSLSIAYWFNYSPDNYNPISILVDGVLSLISFGLAVIVSLISWLIYFVVF